MTKAVINMEEMTVSVQPPNTPRFIPQPWIISPLKKTTKRRNSEPAVTPYYVLKPNQEIASHSINLEETASPFDEFPDVFPPEKTLDLPPLRNELGNHRINLKDPNLE